MQATVAWHIYALTGSKLLLGAIGLAQFVPSLVLSLWGGIVADQTDRTRMVRRCQMAAAVAGPFMAWGAFTDTATPVWIYLAAAVVAGAGSLEQPSRVALLVSLVPREHFPRAVTQSATVSALAFATGPGLAGGLIALSGLAAAYAAQVLLMAVSIVVLHGLPPCLPEARPADAPHESILVKLREGFAHVAGHPVVLGCMLLDMLAVVMGGASALLPVFAEDVLGVGAPGFGMLSASMEVGALAMSAYLAWRRPIERVGQALLGAVAFYGLATLVFGLSSWFPLSLVAYCAVGMADQVSVVLRHTAVQMSTPDHVRGRVSSINMVFIHTSNQLGALESGVVAHFLGAPGAVILGGIAAMVFAGMFALLFPALRRYRVVAAQVS
jgi:MFS family permease